MCLLHKQNCVLNAGDNPPEEDDRILAKEHDPEQERHPQMSSAPCTGRRTTFANYPMTESAGAVPKQKLDDGDDK